MLVNLFKANESPANMWLAKILAVFFAFIFGALIILSADAGFKWLFVCFMSILCIYAAVVFPDYRLFCLLLLTASIPIAIQFDLVNHGSKTELVNHHGGARASWVMGLVDFPIFLLILLWLKDLAANNIVLPRWQPIDTFIASFIVFSCFSLYNTFEYSLLFFEILRYLKYYLLFWILRSYFYNKDHVQLCLYIVVLVSGLQFLTSVLQYFLFFNLPFPVGGVSGSQFDLVNNTLIQRVSGLVGHANTFGGYLLFPIFTSFMIFLFDKHWQIRYAAMGFFILCGITLVLTFSRNSWLMTAALMPIAIYIGVQKKRLSSALIFSMIGLAVLSLAILFLSGVLDVILIRIFEDDGKAYDSRWDLVRVAISMMMDKPVFGIGLNSFEESMSFYDEIGVTNVIRQPVHNISFLIMAETGIISLVLFLLIAKELAKNIMALMKSHDDFNFFLGSTAGIIFIALLVSNQMDITLRKESILGMAVLFASMVVGVFGASQEERHAAKT